MPEVQAARNQDVLPTEAGEQREKETGGHSEKRNSVNPPLIRYNGSLVVCPVLHSLTTSLRALTMLTSSCAETAGEDADNGAVNDGDNEGDVVVRRLVSVASSEPAPTRDSPDLVECLSITDIHMTD